MQKMGKIDQKVLMTGIIVLGVIILALIFSKGSNPYQSTISSTGQSTVRVMPDLVSVYFNVQTQGTTAEQASQKNSEIVTKAKTNLIALGFSEEDVQTQGFNVYPEYDWRTSTQKITGYAATHSIIVKVSLEDKEKIGSVLDAGIGAGAGVGYLNYELNDENQAKYKVQAIKQATEDARNKAEALAEGAGQRLGKLVSISTSDFGYMPWIAYSADSGFGTSSAKSGAEIATSITPSEQEVSATVTAVFKIA